MMAKDMHVCVLMCACVCTHQRGEGEDVNDSVHLAEETYPMFGDEKVEAQIDGKEDSKHQLQDHLRVVGLGWRMR